MLKGHSYGTCIKCGKTHRPKAPRITFVCLTCGKQSSAYRPPIRLEQEPPKYCGRECWRKRKISEETREKQRVGIKKWIVAHPNEWLGIVRPNGKRLQQGRLAYRHKVGWKPPLGFAEKVRAGVLRTYTEHPEIKDKLRVARMGQILPKEATSIELAMRAALDVLEIDYSTNQPVLGICQPDIVILDKKVAIFCDGDYWHNLPSYIVRDARQNEALTKAGWKVLRFWEHEIVANPEKCAAKVLGVIP